MYRHSYAVSFGKEGINKKFSCWNATAELWVLNPYIFEEEENTAELSVYFFFLNIFFQTWKLTDFLIIQFIY